MERKVFGKDSRYAYCALLALVGIVTLLPAGYNYIMDGGLVTEWTDRVWETSSGLQDGQLQLFSSVNSGLWLLIPGFLFRISGNITRVYCLCMLLLQMGTLLAAILFFQGVFADRETRLPSLYGVLLYMTCPYRIYVCYDLADLPQAVVWMLLPLYAWAVIKTIRSERKWPYVLAAGAVLAGTGYAAAAFFLIISGAAVLAGLVWRKAWILSSVPVGGVLFLPGLYRLSQYLFSDKLPGPAVCPLPQDGYRLGEFFGSYSSHNGHPGMGMGMLLCLLAGIWMGFVENRKDSHDACRGAAILSGLFIVPALYGFSREILWKPGDVCSRLMALTGSPAVFWGMACFFLCIPAACAVDRISRHENKYIAFAVPAAVMTACIGLCVYQCNILAYFRREL